MTSCGVEWKNSWSCTSSCSPRMPSWHGHGQCYRCMFCILLFDSVGYVFLLLYLCILIVIYALFCIFCFHRANWHSPSTLTEIFPCFFFSVLRQMPGYESQRRATARTLPNQLTVLFYVLFCRLCYFVYCLNVFCTTATGCQPNCN